MITNNRYVYQNENNFLSFKAILKDKKREEEKTLDKDQN
jgi:hypothetical protein